MEWLLFVGICLVAGIILYQDFKERSVSWIAFPVLLILGVLFNLFQKQQLKTLFYNSFVNLALVMLQFLFVFIYFYMRTRSRNFIDKQIGLGDILLIICACFFFPPMTFFLFFILSLFFSLVVFFLVFRYSEKQRTLKTIPLAGLQSLFLPFFIFFHTIRDHDLTTDLWILDLINSNG
ncbi:MAG: prepilin peptidase [Chitinophagaceae bacterium]|nr:prepilin peptidase [Chitinophagaceae bacterium]